MNEERNRQIEEWTSKGAEWCATQLWNAKKMAQKAKKEAFDCKKELHTLKIQEGLYRALKAENEHLKDVIEFNGIRPTKMTLYYLVPDCEDCDGDDVDFYCCDRCDPDYKNVVVSEAWYTFGITDGLISGVTSSFHRNEYECYKIVNERTGEVVYQQEDSHE